MRPRHRDRLARASALWYLASKPEPLVAGYDSPCPAWEAETEDYRAAALRELHRLHDHGAALELVKRDPKAQRHAAHALRRAGLPLIGYRWFPAPTAPRLRFASEMGLAGETFAAAPSPMIAGFVRLPDRPQGPTGRGDRVEEVDGNGNVIVFRSGVRAPR